MIPEYMPDRSREPMRAAPAPEAGGSGVLVEFPA
jgi:hypothetical protein